MDATGATSAVAVTTQPECAWNASAEASWITEVSPTSGQGSGEVRFRALPNPAGRTRQGSVAVNDQHLQVVQDAAPCRFELAINRRQFDANGATSTVGVTALEGCSWRASSTATWITITSGADGTGNGSVAFRVERNGGAARSGSITIEGEGVALSQSAAAPDCSSSIEPTATSISAAGGSRTIEVTSTDRCAWTATSAVPWITITGGAAGSGDGIVTLRVAANTGAARTGTLTIAGHALTIDQAAVNQPGTCAPSIAPTSVNVAGSGATGTVAVTAAGGCTWAATANVGWITITSGASGTGNGTVAFSAAANTGGARAGTLTIAGQPFTVNQATGCTSSIAPTSSMIAGSGGNGKVAVSAATGCTWTATANAAWLTITSGANGTGNGSVAFSGAANTTGARTGTLTIAGHTFTVTQPVVCTYSIAPTSSTIPASGGTGTVAVTSPTGCGWKATSKEKWITITSGDSGSGNGSVAFRVDAQKDGKTRTSSLTIAGNTFTVTQLSAHIP